MTLEHAGRREFAELVPNHVLGHEQLREILAVVDHERVADKIGHNRAVARPGLDRFAVASALLLFDLPQQPNVHIRTFFNRTSHSVTSMQEP